MIELLDLLAGGGLMAVGFLWGGRRQRRTFELQRRGDPEASCGCGHHFALHDGDGRCRHLEVVKSLAESGHGSSRWDVRELECRCQRYTGPEPLPLYVP
jgi:hypothetical protein